MEKLGKDNSYFIIGVTDEQKEYARKSMQGGWSNIQLPIIPSQIYLPLPDGKLISIDVKTKPRKSDYFRENYVQTLTADQVHKSISLTGYYFCIIHSDSNSNTFFHQ